MSGLDPTVKQPLKSEEQGGTSQDQKKEGQKIADTSERSQTPGTPRFFIILTLIKTHFLKHLWLLLSLYIPDCNSEKKWDDILEYVFNA